METTATSAASTAAAVAAATAATTSEEGQNAAAAISSDFETFLRMLTVQLNNQDPLNPVESTDFAVQLATFSGVEQQVRSNDLLESLLAQQSISALSQLANWVGMEARAAVPAAFDGATPVTYYSEAPTGADQATLIVRDDRGREVARTAVAAESGAATWTGTDQTGAVLPPGNYRLLVEYRSDGEVLTTKPAEVFAEVSEARIAGGKPVIVFATGDELPADQVSAVRAPQG